MTNKNLIRTFLKGQARISYAGAGFAITSPDVHGLAIEENHGCDFLHQSRDQDPSASRKQPAALFNGGLQH